MTGIMLSPKTTLLKDKCPCCEKQLELTVKQTPHGMGFKVSIENIKEAPVSLISCDSCGDIIVNGLAIKYTDATFNICEKDLNYKSPEEKAAGTPIKDGKLL